MNIQLTPKTKQFINAQLQLGVYHSASEVIEALVERVAGYKDGSEVSTSILAGLAARQHQSLLQLIDECEPLSTIQAPDGLTNRDHDRILYSEHP